MQRRTSSRYRGSKMFSSIFSPTFIVCLSSLLLLLRFQQCEHDGTVLAADWFDGRLTTLHQQREGWGKEEQSGGKVRDVDVALACA